MENENITPAESQNPVSPVVPATPAKANNSVGALIGAIIIIVILILSGAYLWSTKVQPQINSASDIQTVKDIQPTNDASITALEQSANANDPMIDKLSSQSPSDEIPSIEADLNATDLNAIDKELQSL